MSSVLNHTAPLFTPIAPSVIGRGNIGAKIGNGVRQAGPRAWRAFCARMEVVLDGGVYGAIEMATLVTVIVASAMFMLAAFGVPVGMG